MKRSAIWIVLICGVLLATSAFAQETHPGRAIDSTDAGVDGPPPIWSPTGGAEVCSSPGLQFGDDSNNGGIAGPPSVSDDIVIAGDGGTVSGLEVTLQISHSWVGDINVQLSNGSVSATIVDQPGVPAISACGCANNNIDVVLSDANGTSSVEDACDPDPLAISGTLTPSPDALSAFDGEPADGTWTLEVSDINLGFPTDDDGTLDTWCLDTGSGGGDGGDGGDGGGVPATNTWGLLAIIALVMGTSVFFLGRKARA